ncbi:hypothetical protein ACJD0Z_15345 [Flavobacteriaceae bacterium M23B6Z8]
MRQIAVLLSLFFATMLTAQSLNDLYKESVAAYTNKDYQTFKELNQKALKLHPSQPTLLYNLAVAEVLTGNTEKATGLLKKLISWNASLDYTRDEDLKRLWLDTVITKEIELRREQYLKKQIRSSIFKEFANSMHLEDMVKIDSLFFFTDVHSGTVLQFDAKEQILRELDTLPLSAMAIETGIDGNSVWVATARLPNFKNKTNPQASPTVYKLAINSGKRLDSVLLPRKAIVGSMVFGKDGFLYATNSATPQIFKIDSKKFKIAEVIELEEAFNLQGITTNLQRDSLFIADYIKGILMFPLDMSLKQRWMHSDKYLLKGIDGLTFRAPGSLFAIQNNSTPKKLIQVNYKDDKVLDVELLDNALPLKGEPTNGFYDPEAGYYYISNSQWPFYDKESNANYNSWEKQQIRVLPKK